MKLEGGWERQGGREERRNVSGRTLICRLSRVGGGDATLRPGTVIPTREVRLGFPAFPGQGSDCWSEIRRGWLTVGIGSWPLGCCKREEVVMVDGSSAKMQM